VHSLTDRDELTDRDWFAHRDELTDRDWFAY
jgi:hypothetical protein